MRAFIEVGTLMTQITDWLTHHNINVPAVIATVAVLAVAWIAVFIMRQLLGKWFAHLRGRVDLTYETTLTISRAITGFLWVLTIFVILNVWGVSIGGAWAVLVSVITVVGVGFLATWTLISNFTASFFLMLWRPFQYGQTVELLPEELRGRVTDRNLMFTTLREDSGSVLQIPNNLFFQKMFRVSGHAASLGSGEHG